MTVSGVGYRHARPIHADLAGTVAAAAKTAEAGRFHVRGAFGALYLSLEPETALRELARRAFLSAVPLHAMMPRDLLVVEFSLSEVLDLTDPSVRDEWGLSLSILRSADLFACQEVAAAARRAGYEAILYPSATGEGENLAVFYDRLHPGSSVEVADQRPIDLGSIRPEQDPRD